MQRMKVKQAEDGVEPVRSWPEVVAEYNRRHPDSKIPSNKAARQLHTNAIKKLRMAMLVPHRRGDL